MKAKFGLAMLAALLSTVPSAKAIDPVAFFGAIGGAVKSPDGVPQMGAAVLLFNSSEKLVERTLTNVDGTFRFDSLLPGLYSVKVSLASYVPAVRPNIMVRPGIEGFLTINVATLFSSIELVYMAPGQSPLMSEDWKWVLRGSMSTRPVLRLVASQKPGNGINPVERRDPFLETRGLVAVSGGESGVSMLGAQPDLGTAFALATSFNGTNRLLFSGNVGYGPDSGTPFTSFRTRFSRTDGYSGVTPDIELTLRRALLRESTGNPSLEATQGGLPSLKSVSVSVHDRTEVLENLEIQYGFSLESISFIQTLHYVSPYARAAYDAGDWGTLSFAYSSGAPPVALLQSTVASEDKLVDTMLMEDLAALSYFPRVSVRDGRIHVQRSNNLEFGYRKKFGDLTVSGAVYQEQVSNAALEMESPEQTFTSSDVLPDYSSSPSSYVFNIGRYRSSGFMATASMPLSDNLTVSASYGRGGALTVDSRVARRVQSAQQLRDGIETTQRAWASMRIAGVLPSSGTHFDASYQWGDDRTLTPVHAYITQGMVPMSGLNIAVRQPIPVPWVAPGRFEASAELRNLLSQGYLPVFTDDDRKLMLIHSPRVVRGGFSFIF